MWSKSRDLLLPCLMCVGIGVLLIIALQTVMTVTSLAPSTLWFTPKSKSATLQAGPCTCSFDLPELLLQDSSNVIDCMCSSPTANTSSCPQEKAQINSCPPAQAKEEIQVITVRKEPWYAKDKFWHNPPRFPRCTMDACFNYSRCEGSSHLLIYTYTEPAPPERYFRLINTTRWYTDDPSKACLFFVFMDTPGIYRPDLHPSTLPYWNGGMNHVVITFGDKWLLKGPNPESMENASAMATDIHQTEVRTGFDVSIPLPPFYHMTQLQALRPHQRKYLLTFRGKRYLNSEGSFRSFNSFRNMHNGDDIIVAVSCSHPGNEHERLRNGTKARECEEDEEIYKRYDFADLMNTTFGLAPAGRQSSSYRFIEILSAGAIPVLITDNYVKPFDGLVQWHRCALDFPSAEMHRIVDAVRSMSREQVKRRQRYCLQVYKRRLKDNDALLRSAVEAQDARFMGAFPRWERGADEADEDVDVPGASR